MSAVRSAPDSKPASSAALEDLVVITGFSGAGKSTAMAVFEDVGYFCVDNLPPEMLRSLAELFTHEGSKVERAAVVCDVRGGTSFERFAEILDELEAAGVNHRVLFLQADDQTLLTRYKETRRRHPLGSSVEAAIAAERELLLPVRERADLVIDTEGLKASMLRRKLAELVAPGPATRRLSVTFESFGFKNGPARDADLLFDVRFLPNPHYEAGLRPLTGTDPDVVAFIDRDGELTAFYTRLFDFLDYVLPRYVREGKSHLVVAVGCTGGRHRSVAIVEALTARYRPDEELSVERVHRDLDQPQRRALS